MFGFSLADYTEIWGLNLFTVVIAYVALFGLAAVLARLTGKSLNDEWPSHWAALPLSTLCAIPVTVFFVVRSDAVGGLLLSGPPTAETIQSYTAYMLVIGALSVMFAVFALAAAKLVLIQRLALPSPPVGLALDGPGREDSRHIRSNQVPPHARISDQRPARGREKKE